MEPKEQNIPELLTPSIENEIETSRFPNFPDRTKARKPVDKTNQGFDFGSAPEMENEIVSSEFGSQFKTNEPKDENNPGFFSEIKLKPAIGNKLTSGQFGSGLPTKNGTMIAVISTYVLLVFANVVLIRNSGDSKESKDVLEP